MSGTLGPETFKASAQTFLEVWRRNVSLYNEHGELANWEWKEIASNPLLNIEDCSYLSLESILIEKREDRHTEGPCASTTKKPLESSSSSSKADATHPSIQTGSNNHWSEIEAAGLEVSLEENCICDYHIVYNGVYQVPVLMFRGKWTDGRPLPEKEVHSLLPEEYQDLAMGVESWTFITMQEHPVLLRPWFVLHPCQTAELMAALCPDQRPSSSKLGTSSGPLSDELNVAESSSAARDDNGTSNSSDSYMTRWFSIVGPVVGLKLPLSAYKTI